MPTRTRASSSRVAPTVRSARSARSARSGETKNEPRPIGRPRVSRLSRAEQLREAKRAQRSRDRDAGLGEVYLKLPEALAERLTFVARQSGFQAVLAKFLDDEAIEIADFPQLQLLCWSRHGKFITAEDAWSLFERNRRFVDVAALTPEELRLLERLSRRFGSIFRG